MGKRKRAPSGDKNAYRERVQKRVEGLKRRRHWDGPILECHRCGHRGPCLVTVQGSAHRGNCPGCGRYLKYLPKQTPPATEAEGKYRNRARGRRQEEDRQKRKAEKPGAPKWLILNGKPTAEYPPCQATPA